MNPSISKSRNNARVNSAVELAAKGGLAAMTGGSALIGLWATACMVTALLSNGPAALIQGWFSALV